MRATRLLLSLLLTATSAPWAAAGGAFSAPRGGALPVVALPSALPALPSPLETGVVLPPLVTPALTLPGSAPALAPVQGLAPAAVAPAPALAAPGAAPASPRAAAAASAQLRVVESFAAGLAPQAGLSSPASSAFSDKAALDAGWEGAPQRADEAVLDLAPDAPAARLAPAAPGRPARRESAASAPSRKASLLAGIATAPWALPDVATWVKDVWGAVSPYAQAGGVILGTYAVNRAARWGVDKVAKAARWQPNTRVAVRLVTTIGLWTAGIALSLKTGGASTSALVTTFGLGGVGVTMAVKDYIGNLIEGVKILVMRPFVMGDRVKIGDRTYVVKDMNLRYLVLQPEDLKRSETDMTYVELAATSLTVLKPYENRHKLDLRRPRLSFLGGLLRLPGALARLTKEMPRHQLKRATLWMAAGLGLLIGLPFAKARLGWSLLDAVFPYLQAAAVLFATRSVERWLGGIITRVSEKRGWNPQSTLVVKLGAEVLSWAIGGSVALHFVGLNWGTLMTALGATSVALGWASADILSNLFHGIWLLIKQPFKIGDTIEVETFIGEVADMTLQYVVLDLGDGTHVLVPQSVLKSKRFTRLDPEDIPLAKAKAAAAKAAKDAPPAAAAPAPEPAPASPSQLPPTPRPESK